MSFDGNDSSSSQAPRLTGWPALPMEIRWQIRDYIRAIIFDWPDSNPVLPQLPQVCREWNEWFTHENFRFLVLDQDRLHDFAKFVGRNKERRAYVRYIVLRIRLPEYNCPACDEEEDDATASANDLEFMETMRQFMGIVAKWKGNWFKLDLSIYSPSDGKHGFRDFRLSPDYRYGATLDMYKEHAKNLRQAREADDGKSACPGWNRVCEGSAPCMSAKKRLMSLVGDPRRPHYSDVCMQRIKGGSKIRHIPRARSVHSLIIRNHSYRQISPQLLAGLLPRFPYLYSFHHERWNHPDVSEARVFARRYKHVLYALSGLKSYNLGQSSLVCENHPVLEHHAHDVPGSLSKPKGRLPHHLDLSKSETSDVAAYFIQVIHGGFFCSTGFICAEDLVKAVSRDRLANIEKIEHLTLTSRVLQRREAPSSRAFIKLIVDTGLLAFDTGAFWLRGLILWDGNESDGVLFRFTQDCDDVGPETDRRIKWRSTRYTADDLAPAFEALRRAMGEPNDHGDDIVLYHEKIFEGEYLEKAHEVVGKARAGPYQVGMERQCPTTIDPAEFPEMRGMVLHPESAKQRVYETLALKESRDLTA